MNSLHTRLRVVLGLVILVLFSVHWMILSAGLDHVSQRLTGEHVEHHALSSLHTLRHTGPRNIAEAIASVDPSYTTPGTGHFIHIWLAGQRVYATPGSEHMELPATLPTDSRRAQYTLYTHDDHHYIIASEEAAGEGGLLRVILGEEVHAAEELTDGIRLVGAALAVPILGLAILAVVISIRSAMKPLLSLRRQLEMSQGVKPLELSPEVPDEVLPLAVEINKLIAQSQDYLTRSRTVTANLAHAIKRPLTIMVRGLGDPRMPQDLRAVYAEQLGAVRSLVERELRRARFAGPLRAGQMIQLHDEVTALTEVMQRVYSSKPLSFEVDVPRQSLAFDREDVIELMGNLLDNACKWTRRRVRVQAFPIVSGDRSSLEISVSDDGPGCTPEQAATLAFRGVRLDETQDGHGHGLAIVRDLVDAYDGTLEIDEDPDLGGMRVTATLVKPG